MSDFVQQLFSLEDKVALVTGASSGIGKHLAQVFSRAGAKVVVIARREQQLTELVDVIQTDGGQASACRVDLLTQTDFQKLASEVAEPFGLPDILVNAAGLNLRQSAKDVTQEDWEKTLKLNLSVPFFLAQALVPAMKEKRQGNIINIASLQSFRAFKNGIAYGASKGGIAQLTRAMAEAWSKYGITANAIAPGFFPTELTAAVFKDQQLSDNHAQATAIGRNGQMNDLDGTAIFLASRASAYVTGQIIAVDGGYLAK